LQPTPRNRPASAAPSLRPTATSGRAKLVAAGGILALGGALAWGFGGTARAPAPAQPVAPVPTASVALPPVPAVDEPLNVQALPMLGETPAPVATPAAITPEDLGKPAAVKHKTAAPPHPAVAPHTAPAALAPRSVAPAKPKRKVVDDGF
jgi:hypothetical protein